MAVLTGWPDFVGVDAIKASYTAHEVYKKVESHCTDLWYSVEDDYIHYPSAIQEILDTTTKFETMTGRMIAINPHDDIWRYYGNLYPSFIMSEA